MIVLNEKEKTVVQYIKDYEAKGYSDKKIIEALKKSGIDEKTIKKCMHYVKPLYKKPLFWVGVLLLILGIALLVWALWPEAEVIVDEDECSRDSDCLEGYECSRGECVLIEEPVVELECYVNSDCGSGYKCVDNECEKKGAEPQCGDGDCNIGEESCVLDCGCTTNDQCEELGYDYCSTDGACMDNSGSSGGGSSGSGDSGGTADTDEVDGVVTSVCVDNSSCDLGKICVDGSCVYGVEDCDNGIDDDKDNLIDCDDDDCDGDDVCPSGMVEDCDNGVDDNGDELVDCDDYDCINDPACGAVVEDCTNGVDDNGDGLIDCKDWACEPCLENCNNEDDDDRDHLIDCEDPDCVDYPACLYECNNGIDDDNDLTYDYYGVCKISNIVNGMAAPTNGNPEGFYSYISCSGLVNESVNRDNTARLCLSACEGDLSVEGLGGDYIGYDTDCSSATDDSETFTVAIVVGVVGQNILLSLDVTTPYEFSVLEAGFKPQVEETQREGYLHGEYLRNLNILVGAPSWSSFWNTIKSFVLYAF